METPATPPRPGPAAPFTTSSPVPEPIPNIARAPSVERLRLPFAQATQPTPPIPPTQPAPPADEGNPSPACPNTSAGRHPSPLPPPPSAHPPAPESHLHLPARNPLSFKLQLFATLAAAVGIALAKRNHQLLLRTKERNMNKRKYAEKLQAVVQEQEKLEVDARKVSRALEEQKREDERLREGDCKQLKALLARSAETEEKLKATVLEMGRDLALTTEKLEAEQHQRKQVEQRLQKTSKALAEFESIKAGDDQVVTQMESEEVWRLREAMDERLDVERIRTTELEEEVEEMQEANQRREAALAELMGKWREVHARGAQWMEFMKSNSNDQTTLMTERVMLAQKLDIAQRDVEAIAQKLEQAKAVLVENRVIDETELWTIDNHLYHHFYSRFSGSGAPPPPPARHPPNSRQFDPSPSRGENQHHHQQQQQQQQQQHHHHQQQQHHPQQQPQQQQQQQQAPGYPSTSGGRGPTHVTSQSYYFTAPPGADQTSHQGRSSHHRRSNGPPAAPVGRSNSVNRSYPNASPVPPNHPGNQTVPNHNPRYPSQERPDRMPPEEEELPPHGYPQSPMHATSPLYFHNASGAGGTEESSVWC